MQEIQQENMAVLGWKLSNALELQRSVTIPQTHSEALPYSWYVGYCFEPGITKCVTDSRCFAT